LDLQLSMYLSVPVTTKGVSSCHH